MIKYALRKWDAGKDTLCRIIRQTEERERYHWSYTDIVKMVCRCIFNVNMIDGDPTIDVDNITMIDNGDYQGTLLFMLPFDTCQPSESEYLMTFVGYGSCSGCDTLQSIQSDDKYGHRDETDSYLTLCRDIVNNVIRPYNYGWRNKEMFDHVEDGDVNTEVDVDENH